MVLALPLLLAAVALGTGQAVVDDRQPGHLSGQVLDADTGEPIGGLPLGLYTIREAWLRRPPEPWAIDLPRHQEPLATLLSGPDGAFHFDGLATGRYGLRALAESLDDTEVEVAVTRDALDVSVPFEVRLGFVVQGFVVDDQGAPVADAWVELSGLDRGDGRNALLLGPRQGLPRQRSGADGSFSLLRLPSGRRWVQAHRDDMGWSELLELADDERGLVGPLRLVLPSERGDGDSAAGLGVVLGFDPDGPFVIRVLSGLGAEAAGVQPGDRLVEVDGRAMRFRSRREVLSRCRGAEGSSVRLVLSRGGERQELELRRSLLPP